MTTAEPAWQQIVESLPHIVWTSDERGRTTYVNQRGAEYGGISADAAVEWTTEDVVHPADVPGLVQAWRAAETDVGEQRLDVRLRRVDGQYRWHAMRVVPICDSDGQIVQRIATATDIEDAKQLQARVAEAALNSTETAALLSLLEAHSPIGFLFLDRGLRLVRINGKMATTLGIAGENHAGKSIAAVAPELWPQLETVLVRTRDTGEAEHDVRVSNSAADNDGDPVEWLGNFFPIHADGKIVGIGVFAVPTADGTAQRLQTEVMDEIADGVYIQDAEGRLTYMNRAAERLLGWTEAELRGVDMHDRVHFQNLDGTLLAGEDCVLRHGGTQGQMTRRDDEAFTRSDGSTFPIAYTGLELGPGGELEGTVVVFRDLNAGPSASSAIRVLIVHHAPPVTESVRALLELYEGIEVVADATTASDALSLAANLKPDVALIDYRLPDRDGIATTAALKQVAPDVKVILITDTRDPSLSATALAGGCAGVLDRSGVLVDVVGTVRAVFHGEVTISHSEVQQFLAQLRPERPAGRDEYLTPRESEVFACIREGLSNAAVGERLGMKPNTVRNHVQRILYKLNVHSKLEAMSIAPTALTKYTKT